MAFDGTLKFDTAIDRAGFQTGLSGLGDLAKSGLSGIGDIAKAGMAAVTGAVKTAADAVLTLGKQAVESYADFEQLAGGVETLFDDAAQTVMDNAAKAFQTAGMNANEYMETATASAAAMINSLAGDTALAAKLTDMAVTDMSDNINKMGSDAESVQNAYAGFAKGNFTMLDNLKLGYGGTKKEMERLLEKAKELTGIEYSIDSYADIVQAIHAIQVEMKISGISAEEAAALVASGALTEEEAFERMGTTAKEAQETISGSVAMVKAAWSNLLVGVADDTQDFDKLTGQLVMSVDAAAKNILPRAEQAVGGVVRLVDGLSDDAVRLLTDLTGYAPLAVDAGLSLMDAFSSGIREHLPDLLETGLTTGLEFLSGFGDLSVQFLDVGAELAKQLDAGIEENLPRITGTAREIALRIIKAVGDYLPDILTAGAGITEMLVNSLSDDMPRFTVFGNRMTVQLTEGLRGNLPNLLGMAKNLIGSFGSSMLSSLPVLLDCAVQVLETVVDVISDPEDLSAVIAAGILIIRTLGGALLDNVQPVLDAGGEIIGALIGALADPDALTGLLNAALAVITALVGILTENAGMAADAAVQIVTVLGAALLTCIPLILQAGAEVLRSLIGALSDPETLTELLDAGLLIITSLAEILMENLSPLLEAVIAIISALGVWLGEHALDLVGAGLAIVQAVVDAVIQNLPLLLDVAVQIVEGLCRGIEEDSEDVLIAVEQILRTLLDFLLSPDTLRMVGETGGKIIRALIPAAKELAADLLGFAYDLFTEYGEALLTPDWDAIGKSIVEGILSGLLGVDFDSELFKADFAENWVSGIKELFGIHSPSKLMRDEVGKNLALGIEVGLEENIPDIGGEVGAALAEIPDVPEIRIGFALEDVPEIPETEEPEGVVIPAAYEVPDVPVFASPDAVVVPVEYDAGEMPEPVGISDSLDVALIGEWEMPEEPVPDDITVSLADDAVRILEELRAARVQVVSDVDPEVLEALRVSPVPDASELVPQSVTSVVNNSYQYNSSTSNVNTSSVSAVQEQAASRGGDIVTNVYIGEEKLETVVMNVLELVNARSGGGTI